MNKITHIETEIYGAGDGRAINRHSNRTYMDQDGNYYEIDRNLSAVPHFFMILGPMSKDFKGISPVIKVEGRDTFGDGLSWRQAERVFLSTINAEFERAAA